jgi:hypothetical protein
MRSVQPPRSFRRSVCPSFSEIDLADVQLFPWSGRSSPVSRSYLCHVMLVYSTRNGFPMCLTLHWSNSSILRRWSDRCGSVWDSGRKERSRRLAMAIHRSRRYWCWTSCHRPVCPARLSTFQNWVRYMVDDGGYEDHRCCSNRCGSSIDNSCQGGSLTGIEDVCV